MVRPLDLNAPVIRTAIQIVGPIAPIALDLLTQLVLKKRDNAGTVIGTAAMLLISLKLNKIPNLVMLTGYVAFKVLKYAIGSQIDKEVRTYYQDEKNFENQKKRARFQRNLVSSARPVHEKA